MKTTTAKKSIAKTQQHTEENTPIVSPGVPEINTGEIDIHPNNYRKIFRKNSIEELAENLAQHGMISSLTVRNLPGGRYQLVAGERRFRAALLAGLPTVPAIIRDLTDEQVMEMQLAENMQREDPHPLDEAHRVALLQTNGKSIPEIAARLGKSNRFVYDRIKLSGLIEPMQQVFLADKLNIQDALEIAALSAESQQEFFNNYCANWEQDSFRLWDIKYNVNRYKYDLKDAPFDTANESLVPEASACGQCSYNTATMQTLFPEMAKEAKCTNLACFNNKCTAHFLFSIRMAVAGQQPEALLIYGQLSEETRILLDSLPETAGLPQFSQHEVFMYFAPELPDKEDYTETWGIEEGEEGEFDQESYDQAVQEYETDLEEFTTKLKSGELAKGLLIKNGVCSVIPYGIKGSAADHGERQQVTAKAVQEAIKAGTATAELLQAEIERIGTKEVRSKELDREKVQAIIHEQFSEAIKNTEAECKLNTADLAAVRLLVYQSLDWHSQKKMDSLLFNQKRKKNTSENEHKYKALTNLSDAKFSLLIRTAVASKSDSKIPGLTNAISLYQVAEASGLNVAAIEKAQADKAKDRQGKQKLRIKDLEYKIKKLEARKAA